MAPSRLGARLLLPFVLAVSSACATGADRGPPRHPGDRCLHACAEGMVCASTGRCELAPDRCVTAADCHNHRAICGNTTYGIGYCDVEPPDAPLILPGDENYR